MATSEQFYFPNAVFQADGFVNDIPFTQEDDDMMNDIFTREMEEDWNILSREASKEKNNGGGDSLTVPMMVHSNTVPPLLENSEDDKQGFSFPARASLVLESASDNEDVFLTKKVAKKSGKSAVVQKRETNRKHAQKSRLRKIRFLEALQDRVDNLKDESQKLQNLFHAHAGEKALPHIKTITTTRSASVVAGGNTHKIPHDHRSGISDVLFRAKRAYELATASYEQPVSVRDKFLKLHSEGLQQKQQQVLGFQCYHAPLVTDKEANTDNIHCDEPECIFSSSF